MEIRNKYFFSELKLYPTNEPYFIFDVDEKATQRKKNLRNTEVLKETFLKIYDVRMYISIFYTTMFIIYDHTFFYETIISRMNKKK